MKEITQQNNNSTFKMSYNKLRDCIFGGYEFIRNNEKIKIAVEHLNPYNCEGYLDIWVTVDEQNYYRNYENEVSNSQLINFINKFVNKSDYRKRFSVGK